MISICVFSFLFDGIFSLIFNTNSLFLSLFSIMCLIVIYPYLKNRNNIFYIGPIMGLFFDIVYTQTLFLNTLLFFLITFLIYFYYKYMPFNIINTLLISFFSIIIYRSMTYICFLIFYDDSFNIYTLIKSIYSSIIINYIYVLIMNSLCKILLKTNKKINKIK